MTLPPRAILFDWDNTLVDNWTAIHHAMNTALAAMGHAPWDMDETMRRVAKSLKNAFPPMFGERWQEARDIYYDSFKAVHLDLLKPLPGAADSLDRLCQAGIPLGVVSNKSGPILREEAEFLGWTHRFAKMAGAGDAAADKPSDLPVRLVLDAIGVPAGDRVWFVGDMAIDMECAHNSGVQGVLVRHHPWDENEFKAAPPHHAFKSWPEFSRFLDEIPIP